MNLKENKIIPYFLIVVLIFNLLYKSSDSIVEEFFYEIDTIMLIFLLIYSFYPKNLSYIKYFVILLAINMIYLVGKKNYDMSNIYADIIFYLLITILIYKISINNESKN